MITIVSLVTLASLVFLVISLIRPRTFIKILRTSSRWKQAGVFSGLALTSFIVIGVVAPKPQPKEESAPVVQTQPVETIPTKEPVNPVSVATAPKPTPPTTPKMTEPAKQAAAPASQSQTESTKATTVEVYAVTKVVDGDTFKVSIAGKEETLRMIGIDTPETVDPRKPVQCFGMEASNKAKALLTGKKVRLEADPGQGERDKYGRLLRYAFLENGTSFNLTMIAEGYAHEYTYSTPYKYQRQYKQAETEAREAKRGLWADDACVAPSEPVATQPSSTASNLGSGAPGFTCAGKTTCSQMVSCEEAKYYLNTCGVSRLDGDKDGTPCDSLCK